MKKINLVNAVQLILLTSLLLVILAIVPFSNAENIIYGNYRNVSVRTYVNITNAKPEVLSLFIYQDTNITLRNITLSAGSIRTVNCNATIRDWNGYTDIVGVNGTLWDSANSEYNTTDNNNTHYTNANCTSLSNGVNYTVNYICNFSVYYYANNGTWVCNVTAIDTFNKTGYKANTTVFYPVYALNLTNGIDYGNVAAEDYSVNRTANITNFGNMAINISVEGYGAVRGDGLAMNCSLGGNISVSNERFAISDLAWGSMTALTGSSQSLAGLTIIKQTDPVVQMINTTYWQLYLDSKGNPGGNCSGYVLFSATAP
jgi:hypothetical protein